MEGDDAPKTELEVELQEIVKRSPPRWQVMWSQVDGGFVRCDVELLGHQASAVSRSKKRALVFALVELSKLVDAAPEDT